jgi:hypothetical protein
MRQGLLPIQLEASEQAIEFAHSFFMKDYIGGTGGILEIDNED